ncbi:MAG: arginase [Anaerovoracaceae bacterium]
MEQEKKIHVIGVQMDKGAGTRGVDMGPYAIRYAGLIDGIKNLGYDCVDKGDIISTKEGITSNNMKNFDVVSDINTQLYNSVCKSFDDGALPVILGGDHSIAAGSISATAQKYKNIGVIWVDAHGDWNSADSSPSGNMHGMPFSAVCGAGPKEMIEFGQEHCFVDTKNCVQIGGRDIDSIEKLRMKEHGVTVFSIADIDRLGMPEVVRQAIEIASNGTEGFHLSYDVDAITPEAAPGTGTIVHSGLTVREAFYLVETIAQTGKMLAIDMVEVNPMLDDHNRTGVLASELILAAIGKTVY